LTKILSLKINANIKKPKATIINLNESEAKGLADRTIICPLTKAELQKKQIKKEKGLTFILI